jgi:hypothetical protein
VENARFSFNVYPNCVDFVASFPKLQHAGGRVQDVELAGEFNRRSRCDVCDSLSVRLFFRVLAVSAVPLRAAFFLGADLFFMVCPLPLIRDPLAKTSDVNQHLATDAPDVWL